MSDRQPLVVLEEVSKHFRPASRLGFLRPGRVRAVDGVSLTIGRGEIVGLVGESGAGKSTLGRLSIALERPAAGRVRFEEVEIHRARGQTLKLLRHHAQLVASDPRAQLDPTLSVGRILQAPLQIHERLSRGDRRMRVDDLLTMVGLSPAFATMRPPELTPGQCQRVVIARAVAIQPRFLVLDEPTTALDPTIQAQILNLLVALKERFNLALLFITHDLRLARYMSDRIAVMHRGRIVEIGAAEDIWRRPRHPYARALLAAVAEPSLSGGAMPLVRGEPPAPTLAIEGCSFHSRCPQAGPRCRSETPRDVEVQGVRIACHLEDGGVGTGAD